MKVLITGGNGFIGRHLVNRLKARGEDVEVFDLPDDIRDFALLKKRIKGKDLVWHFAAIADLNWARKHDKETFDINVTGTINVAKACAEEKVKLNYISTCCVYGNQKKHPSDEKTPPNPSEIYAYSKLMGEYVLLSYVGLFNLKYNIARISTIYGSGMRPALGVHIFFSQAFKGKPITVHGNGRQTRTFTYIEDIVSGLEKLTYFKGEGEIFNLSAKEEISANDMARKIKRLTKSKSKIIHILQRPGQTFKEQIDSNKAKRLLNWQAKTTFEKGLQKTYSWIKPT